MLRNVKPSSDTLFARALLVQLAAAGLLVSAGVPVAAFGGWFVFAMSCVVIVAAFVYGPKLAAAISLSAQNLCLSASQARGSFATAVAALISALSLSTDQAAELSRSNAPACTHRIADAIRARIRACAVTLTPRITPAPRVRRARPAAA